MQLRRDYDMTLQNCEQLSQKLTAAFEECEMLRVESEDAVKEAKTDKRENQRLKQLTSDLGRQVQVNNVYLTFPFLPTSLPSLPLLSPFSLLSRSPLSRHILNSTNCPCCYLLVSDVRTCAFTYHRCC